MTLDYVIKSLQGIQKAHGNTPIVIYEERTVRYGEIRAIEFDESLGVTKIVMSNDLEIS